MSERDTDGERFLADIVRGVQAAETFRQMPDTHLRPDRNGWIAECWSPQWGWHKIAAAGSYCALGIELTRQGRVPTHRD